MKRYLFKLSVCKSISAHDILWTKQWPLICLPRKPPSYSHLLASRFVRMTESLSIAKQASRVIMGTVMPIAVLGPAAITLPLLQLSFDDPELHCGLSPFTLILEENSKMHILKWAS